MGLTFEPLGKYVRLVDERNTNKVTETVLGINIDKYFMPSVANTIGTDLSNYKLLRKGRFACNPMHVGRDGRLPVSRYTEDAPAIVSPAYFMFEIIDENEIEPEYLMLCFRRPDFDRMCWFRTDASVRGGITWDDVCALTIPIPSLPEQRKIVHVYQVITDRIKLLRKMNKNLYQQLFALYDYYCDSADDGEIELGALCQFQEGYVNPAQTHPEYFDGDVKWLRAVDINESFIIETSRTLTQTGFQSAKKSAYLFSPNTIAISKSGTIGRLGIVGDYMCGNRAVINIAPKDPLLLPYIYAFLKSHQKQFPDLAVGSVQKNLYVSLLEPLPVRILALDSLSEFCNAGNAILNAVYNNCQENIRLAQLRDTLLPRLMTGELDVSRLTL